MTSLRTLKDFDTVTANGVLAAVALSTSADPGIEKSTLVEQYRHQANAVANEIRSALQLGSGALTRDDQARFDAFLAREIQKNVFANRDPLDALGKAGQAGRLPSSLYKVRVTQQFEQAFRRHGVKKKLVEEAVHLPDDYQHLLNDDARERDTLSLFMKKILPSGKEPHWLLLQTVRQGIIQVAQSAWRVYPADVDLTRAKQPLDVLRAFANVFGVDVKVADKTARFIESVTFMGDPAKPEQYFYFAHQERLKTFMSISHVLTTDPGTFRVGIGYCIDLGKYEASLAKRGFNV
ncbi:MAG: hypothetical protein NW223_01070 [Hyphomicrobiaceae bacterium]|nr:hypothetical protein [Hyphomicrobiaceae bacterium]